MNERKPATFAEAVADYLAEYYLLLGSAARLLRLRSLADAFVMLAGDTPPARKRQQR